MAVPTCLANSGDHRKVVSHIFGRNKGRTRALPDHLWIYWCRKHYQRLKYRAEDTESWHTRQLGLVRTQLQTFENWGQVRSWDIDLRKAENLGRCHFLDHCVAIVQCVILNQCGRLELLAWLHKMAKTASKAEVDAAAQVALAFGKGESKTSPVVLEMDLRHGDYMVMHGASMQL